MPTTKKTGYHAQCYRKFTALGRNAPPKNDNVQSKSVHTRSKRALASGSSSTGIMPKICIFCNKKDKKHNSNKQNLISQETGDFEKKIKKYATTLGDQALLSKLGSADFVAKEIRYHGIWGTKYQTAAEQGTKTSQTKRQQSVQSILGTEEERFILKLSNQYARWWRISSLQVAMCWV